PDRTFTQTPTRTGGAALSQADAAARAGILLAGVGFGGAGLYPARTVRGMGRRSRAAGAGGRGRNRRHQDLVAGKAMGTGLPPNRPEERTTPSGTPPSAPVR